MLIRYTGSSSIRRVVGPYEWSRRTGFTQDVPADFAADLLTSPEETFVVDGEEPLAQVSPVPVTDVIFAALALAGIGSVLLKHLESVAERPILLGTWRANEPAIGFYRRHGYELVGEEHRERLLRTYWAIPERQVEESIVMAGPAWRALYCAGD